MNAISPVKPPRALVILGGAAAAVVVAAGARAAAGLVSSVVLALLIAIAVAPVSGWARRRGWPSWTATALALVAAYGSVLVLVGGLLLAAVELVATLPEYTGSLNGLVADARSWLVERGLAKDPLTTLGAQFDLGKVVGYLAGYLTSIMNVAGSLFFLVTLLFFLCADLAGARRVLDVLHGSNPRLARSLRNGVSGIRSYLLVSAVFGAVVAVLDGVALWILGVPLPWVWALLSFLTNFVPNIGFVLGVIPPAVLGLLEGGWGTMLAVIIVYSALNVVIQTFIQPRYVGDAVGLSPTATFLSLAVWGFILGPLGALLAVPMTLLVRTVLIDPDPGAAWAAALLGAPILADIDDGRSLAAEVAPAVGSPES